MEYLSLPLVLREGYLSRANLEESLKYSIGLIVCTRVGMMPFAPEYGSALWEKEFSDILTANKSDIRAGIRNAIGEFEKRLYNVSVSFTGLEDASPHTLGMIIKVYGNYIDGTEESKFESTYQLG